MKHPKFLDNKSKGKVINELKENIKKGSKLSIISAYFTIYAFNELYKELHKIDEMRFIFTEPTFTNQEKEVKREYYLKRPETPIAGNSFEIKLRNELKGAYIAKECAEWIKEKVSFKSFKQANPAQQRLIYIDNKGEDVSINGTVDFTTDGLGVTNSSRVDMNTCIYGREYTRFYLDMFNQIWEDDSIVEDIKNQVLAHMEGIYKENTPEYLYFVTLYHVFNHYLDELTEEHIVKTKTGFKDTIIWNKLYKFQKDGVLGAINKIEKFGGCILADSVGLGKTFEALAVIKYYELRNDRVLVLCPKKLRENWTIYTQNDKRNLLEKDRFNYDVLNHTDLSRYDGYSGEINLKTVNWANYDLVVIDESHNFRNNNARNDKVTRYTRLMNDIIKAGVKTKVLMLSATPVNNGMNDIKNQIAFITEGDDRALSEEGIDSIELVLRKAQTVFNRWTKLDEEERTTDTFVEMINMDYFKLLDTLTIARSRNHIKKYYNIAEIGKFPKRLKPQNIYPGIDLNKEFPPLEEVNKAIKNLNLSVYSPLSYLLPNKREEYSKKYDIKVKGGNVFKQTDREQALVGLMRIGILKRMESSINSFELTVGKILGQINGFIEKINRGLLVYDQEVSILDVDLDSPELDDLLIGNKVKVLLQDMDLLKWKDALMEDKLKLENLLQEAHKVDSNRDEKLHSLKERISDKIKNPINAGNRKIIIFTAFADTANYLYDHLADWANKSFNIHTAVVTGSGTNRTTMKGVKTSDLNEILTHFSPKSKERDKAYLGFTEEIDLLIATDCISEGQNLQDCDYLINYDIHWNPVRIIQRFGRIDRLGSTNDRIQLVNYWPTNELDEYINLESRVTGRMVLLDISATGEENVIEYSQNKGMNDLEYRKKQLEKLQNQVVDLEDISGGISITDLTMNDFRVDLMEYMKEHKKELKNAPLGMYAIVPIPEEMKGNIEPGVIFTVRQVNNAVETLEQNPLYPNYMVYINNEGEVKYNYINTKRILDYYKKLCSGQNEVLWDLVNIFNTETNSGQDMSIYSSLLEEATQSIVGKKEEIGIASLFSKGGTTLQKSLFSTMESFELISFLIIK